MKTHYPYLRNYLRATNWQPVASCNPDFDYWQHRQGGIYLVGDDHPEQSRLERHAVQVLAAIEHCPESLICQRLDTAVTL